MKKTTKIVVTLIIVGVLTILLFYFGNKYINDENKLTIEEKEWINDSISTVQNVNIINNSPVFGNNGYGVFYNFLDDFSKEYNLKVNPITYNINTKDVDSGFRLTHNIDNNQVIFYSDYYVLMSSKYEQINNISLLNDKKIGALAKDYDYLKEYLPNVNIVQYETENDLNTALTNNTDINYAIVPRLYYMNNMIINNMYYVYHFSDIKIYYTYQTNNDTLSSVIKKYYASWNKKNLNKNINTNLLKDLTVSLNLSEIELKELTSKVYNYGFVNNSPYEVLMGGTYGGIVSEYLKPFSNITGIEFKFTKYRNYNAFNNALDDNKVDLYFNYYRTSNNYKDVFTGMNVNYFIIADEKSSLIVNSLASLKGQTVYVLEDSILQNHLINIKGVTIKTYKNYKELKKAVHNKEIIMIDSESFNYYNGNGINNYNIRYSGTTDATYLFKLKDEGPFNRLLQSYIMLKDPQTVKIKGIYNHNKTVANGSILGNIAKYILYIVIAAFIIFLIFYKTSKKVRISKKIKKEDKIKYIDQLTSLKNRNYLNENIDAWNKNTLYPQTIVVVDLDKLQKINDSYGYEHGDEQIKSAANILIKTQLDNSDIIRSDGNEFIVYLIGYDEKNIVSYIRKLYKEFKNMPYEYNATIGYSMITDDLKTIEDAINEAVVDMKSKKEE